MATVLFFAGMGIKLRGRVVPAIMIFMASALFIGALVSIFSLPQTVEL